MKALRSWLACLAVASVSVAAPAQQPGGVQPAAAGDIAAAVTDCWNAVGTGAVDSARLQAAGWKAATATDGKGKSAAMQIALYGKSGSNALIMLASPTPTQSICSVIASVQSPPDIGKAIGTIQRALMVLDPQVKTARSGTGIAFLALPKLAMADVTGTKEKPGLRIVVGYQNPEKK